MEKKICLNCWWYKEFELMSRRLWYRAEGQCLKSSMAIKDLKGNCVNWKSKEEELIARKVW